jgi:GNAT superfamily N-acetyltransferase
MSKLQILPATESDLTLILDLIRGLAAYERLSHTVTATPEALRESLFGARPAAEVLLAYWDEECAGFALFFPTYSTFLARPGLYLEDLYVHPHLRTKGIGFALVRELASIATKRGCARLEWGVLGWNERAIRFYKKLGASPMDNWTKYRLEGEAIKDLVLSVH